MTRKAIVVVLLALGCDSKSPSDVAGTYTLSLTVQQIECGILAGQVGGSLSEVMVVTQSGSDASGQVQGSAGLAVGAALGSDTFTGKVAGDSLDLAIAGAIAGSDGTCAFTRTARMQATLSGDVLTGTVTYNFATNRTADCGTRDTCKDVHRLSGTRPPRVSS